MFSYRSYRIFLFFLIVILAVFDSFECARKNNRKRKQQLNRQFEESLPSSHAFDAVHNTYGSSLFDLSPQELHESGASETSHQCQKINIELCSDIGYNVTSMPNFVGHESQSDAETQLQTFTPLISYGCASQLKFFLCSVYTPMCTEKVPVSIGPCRPLCESVHARCAPVLLELGFTWPEALNCSKFVPENTVDHMCMEGPPPSIHEKINSHVPSQNSASFPKISSIPTNFDPENDKKPNTIIEHNPNNFVEYGRNSDSIDEPRVNHMPHSIVPVQPKVGQIDLTDSKWARQIRSCIHYRHSEQYAWLRMHSDGGRCVPKCLADIRFSSSNKRSVEYWTTIWSLLAVLSCLITLVIVAFCRSIIFKYPERPVIYITLCSLISASTYLYRAAIGRDVMSCASTLEQRLLVQKAEFNPHCTLSFIMLYYFGMASAAWFLVLSGTWASAYALRTPLSKLANRRTFYHTFAWIVPALQTLCVLVTRAVDADELTGTCSVGNQDTESLLRFVLTPLALYLSVSIALFGLALLFARFVHVCNSESNCCVGDVELSDRSSEQNSEHDSNSTTTGCSDFCRRSNRSSSDSRVQQNLIQNSSGQPLLLVPGAYTATLSSTTSYNSGKGSNDQRTRTHAAHPLYADTKTQINSAHVNRFRLRSSCTNSFDSTFDPNNADSSVLVRAGIFALFYIVPTLFVLASIIYEYDKRDSWLLKRHSELVESIFQHTPASNPDVQKIKLDGSDSSGVIESADSPLPNFEIFSLRLFMSLFIGMSTSIWFVITHGQFGLFQCRRFIKKSPFETVTSACSGPAHMALLSKNPNNLAFHAAKTNSSCQPETHFFTGYFPSQNQHSPAIPQQPILQQFSSQHAHPHQFPVGCSENQVNHHPVHHLKGYPQIILPGSNLTTSTTLSSGHAFAYPNPNLVLDNHWGEHTSSASYRTGNETAV